MTSAWSCHPAEPAGAGYRDEPPLRRRWRVLVIDDDPAILNVLQLALRRAGIDCFTAASGSEAEKIGSDPSIDLLLVDLRLGDTDGFHLIERLREQGHEIPFAIITGYGSVPLAVQAVQSGALDVIEKPFLPDDVVAKIRAWLLAGESVRTDRQMTPDAIDTAGLSAAERWAVFVLRGTQAQNDPKTLDQWVPHAHTNYTSLRGASELLGIRPHDARDFMRMLRAAMYSQQESQALEAFLDVHDLRGLRPLFERSGLGPPRPGVRMSAGEFMQQQRFIPAQNEGFKALVRLLRQRKIIR